MQVMLQISFVPTLNKTVSTSQKPRDRLEPRRAFFGKDHPVKTGSKHSGTRHLRGYPFTK